MYKLYNQKFIVINIWRIRNAKFKSYLNGLVKFRFMLFF